MYFHRITQSLNRVRCIPIKLLYCHDNQIGGQLDWSVIVMSLLLCQLDKTDINEEIDQMFVRNHSLAHMVARRQPSELFKINQDGSPASALKR